MRQRVQVPLRTLVRVSDLQIYTIIDDFARLEPPRGRAQPERCAGLGRQVESGVQNTGDHRVDGCPADRLPGSLTGVAYPLRRLRPIERDCNHDVGQRGEQDSVALGRQVRDVRDIDDLAL
jgi:hypothetical protein